MAKQMVRKASSSDVAAKEGARADFAAIIDKLDAALKSGPKLFPSGIELIKLTVKVGTDVEFSVVVAGKDAPKVDTEASISDPAIRQT